MHIKQLFLNGICLTGIVTRMSLFYLCMAWYNLYKEEVTFDLRTIE